MGIPCIPMGVDSEVLNNGKVKNFQILKNSFLNLNLSFSNSSEVKTLILNEFKKNFFIFPLLST